MTETVENVVVSFELVTEAYNNFVGVFYPHDNRSGLGLYFWNFLKMNNEDFEYKPLKGWTMPSRQAKLVEMMVGRNYHTVMKAMEARGHDWQHEAEDMIINHVV